MSPGPGRRSRAERAGIQLVYTGAGGGRVRAPARTQRLLLAALGDEERERRSGTRSGARCVAPGERCVAPGERIGRRTAFGLWANLYSLRSDRGLGIGNLSDLRALVRLTVAAGGVFVGVSPLHAVRNRPPEVSPYQPLSRLFRNPLYLDVTAVPEWRQSPEARRALEAGAGARARERLLAGDRIDYAGCGALHRRVCAILHRTFRSQRRSFDTQRSRDYARFCERSGEPLIDFATFCALEEHLARQGRPRDRRRWPGAWRSPRAAAVRRFRETHAEQVDFHVFLQFELDRQLAAVAREARSLAIGLYPDLAVGSAASGFDGWAFPDAFVGDVSLGAPPDDYARKGQDWGLPPLHPRRLAADDYRFFRLLLRAGFEHAGMLRIDHVLGLVRQYWIPSGEPPARGAYVRFPGRELLTVIAEESRRAGAVVVGEDLGTVPPGLPSLLARFGVLSSRVLMFERDRRGAFRPARRYSARALVTANTHDLPTLPALWSGSDLVLRSELGLFADRRAHARALAERDALRRALRRRLLAGGDLAGADAAGDPAALCAAAYRFLCRTRSPLVGVSLDDLAGETRPVNLPGVAPDVFPSWTRRMDRSLASLARAADVERALAGVATRRRRA